MHLDPNHPDALHLLGVILSKDPARSSRGIGLIRQAISARPNSAIYRENLGVAMSHAGDFSGAINEYQRALAIDGNVAETWFNLANALRNTDQFDDAIAAYDRAIAIRPDLLAAINNRAMALHEAGRFDEAINAFEAALRRYPNSPELWKNLGNSLQSIGRLDEAAEAYKRASVDPRAAGNVLYLLNYIPKTTIESVLLGTQRWAQTYAAPLSTAIQLHSNDRAPERKLRVGFTSPDFLGHPVGRFLLPLFAHHDAAQFEFFCYSDTLRTDDITDQLKGFAQSWHVTHHLTDEQLAAQVRQDQIDILVDLTMHTRGNRLLTFARKPAPVQATYLAYVGTTGLATIDYRFTDAFLDPPKELTPWLEKPVHLKSLWCYRPPSDAGPVTSLPSDLTGHITFGCLNAFQKINRNVSELWSAVLDRVPGAKCLLHVPEGSARLPLRELFGARVEFVTRIARRDYFELYGRIDIALDPFPYPGGTTTCDALWMGVPVVTLGSGALPMAQAGVSILSNATLPELIADSREQYVSIAASLAADQSRLRELRQSIRDRLTSSPLMDELGFTRDFEFQLRKMWTTWCDAEANQK